MKRAKVYQKGKHIYVKSGSLKEVRLAENEKGPECEFDENYHEVYADLFSFKPGPKGIKINFGKQIFGTNLSKFKRAVFLDKKTARQFLDILEQTLKQYKDDPGRQPPSSG